MPQSQQPGIEVTDEHGNTHIFPAGTTEAQIYQAMGIQPPAEGFVGGALNEGKSLGQGLYQTLTATPSTAEALTGPGGTLFNRLLLQPTLAKGRSTIQAFEEGSPMKGVLGALATLDPLSPDVTKLYSQSASGDPAGAAGHGAVQAALLALGSRLGDAPSPTATRMLNTGLRGAAGYGVGELVGHPGYGALGGLSRSLGHELLPDTLLNPVSTTLQRVAPAAADAAVMQNAGQVAQMFQQAGQRPTTDNPTFFVNHSFNNAPPQEGIQRGLAGLGPRQQQKFVQQLQNALQEHSPSVWQRVAGRVGEIAAPILNSGQHLAPEHLGSRIMLRALTDPRAIHALRGLLSVDHAISDKKLDQHIAMTLPAMAKSFAVDVIDALERAGLVAKGHSDPTAALESAIKSLRGKQGEERRAKLERIARLKQWNAGDERASSYLDSLYASPSSAPTY